MSQINEENNKKDRWKRELCITSCKAVSDFFEHFKVPYTTDLPRVLKEFESKPTVELQKQIRLLLTKEIATNEAIKKIEGLHPIVFESSQKAHFEMQFEKDLEEVLEKR